MQSFAYSALLGRPLGGGSDFTHPAFTVFGRSFQTVAFVVRPPHRGPTTPGKQVSPVWANPLSLAATHGITSFSFPRVTEMFHFTPYRFLGL